MKETLITPNGSTQDIIDAILSLHRDAEKMEIPDTLKKAFGENPTIEKLAHELWCFVRDNIKFQDDPNGHQYITLPRRVYLTKVGDSKSYVSLIGAVLRAYKFDYTLRFVSYNRHSPPHHVYIVCQGFIIDAANPVFNTDKNPYQSDNYEIDTSKHIPWYLTQYPK